MPFFILSGALSTSSTVNEFVGVLFLISFRFLLIVLMNSLSDLVFERLYTGAIAFYCWFSWSRRVGSTELAKKTPNLSVCSQGWIVCSSTVPFWLRPGFTVTLLLF